MAQCGRSAPGGEQTQGNRCAAMGLCSQQVRFQESLRNLQAAVDNLRASKGEQHKGAQMCFPKRKTRKRGLGACRFTGTIKVLNNRIQLPIAMSCGQFRQGQGYISSSRASSRSRQPSPLHPVLSA